MPKELTPLKDLPLSVVSDALNQVTTGLPRTTNKENFLMHVSDALSVKGPRAFCPRQQVLAYHSKRVRTGGKLTPARRLLFATGHFQHEYIVDDFIKNSPFAGYLYAKWTCSKHNGHSDENHDIALDIRDNVIGRKCRCGRSMLKHNEIDLIHKELMLTGHPDMILYYGGRYYIYEFKTIDRRDVDFDTLTTPLAEHTLQVSFYYNIMKDLGMNVSKRLSIMYADRSNAKLWGGLPYKTLCVAPLDGSFMRPFRNKLLHAKFGFETGKLPDRICPDISCERARNCDFGAECFNRQGSMVTPDRKYRLGSNR